VTAPAVVVIGDALLDVQVAPRRALRTGADVPAEIRLGPGGQGANLAIRLARQGIAVTLVASLADDTAGTLVREALALDGVVLRAVPASSTGSVVVLRDTDGERTMLSQRVAFGESVTPDLLADAAWVVISGYLLLEPRAGALAGLLAGLAPRRALVGCSVPADGIETWRAAAAALRPDLLILNRHERSALGHQLDAGITAITDADGATLATDGVSLRADAPAGPPAVDTTGAGDAFAAGLLAAIVDADWPPGQDLLRGALAPAVELASAVARVEGAQAAVAGERPATLAP
jgi:sugar/nucleoside kinase (ribokinase family)